MSRTIFTGWVRYRDIIEPYMPKRALRQLGYVQGVPSNIHRPTKAVRRWESKYYKVEFSKVTAVDAWSQFPNQHVLPVASLQPLTPGVLPCNDTYLWWFYSHSYPRLLNNDVSVDPDIPARSNSEYWVSRSITMLQGTIRFLPDDQAAAYGS